MQTIIPISLCSFVQKSGLNISLSPGAVFGKFRANRNKRSLIELQPNRIIAHHNLGKLIPLQDQYQAMINLTKMNEQKDILIVDHEPNEVIYGSKMLKYQGDQVRNANNGEMTLKAIAAQIPDLMLLEIKMPSMNGFDLCQRIKNDSENTEIPIVFLG